MSQTAIDLQLVLAFPEPGHLSPTIQLLDRHGVEHGRIPTTEPAPCLPFDDETVATIDARDILEHVHDEQTWLAECARILVSNGELVVRVPLENMMAWADARNIYRYIVDMTNRGSSPRETIPTGWRRHYAPTDLPDILTLAGFETVSITTQGSPIEEIPHLAGLVVGDVVLQRHETEHRLFRLRQRFRNRPRLPLPRAIAATMTIRANRIEPRYQPVPELDESHRPELESTAPLE